MEDKLGILFLHHDVNDVVENNLASMRRQNPDATIVTMGASCALPNGYSLQNTPEVYALHAKQARRSGDWLVCSWFAQRKERCDKWWVTDWDAYCTMPIREYYAAVWKLPLVAPSIRLMHRDPKWFWFRGVKKLPEKFRAYAMGIVPSLYLVDEDVLGRICTVLLRERFTAGNAELRFGTAANWCGFPPCGYSPPGDGIGCIPWSELPNGKGIFHPVKFHAGVVDL